MALWKKLAIIVGAIFVVGSILKVASPVSVQEDESQRVQPVETARPDQLTDPILATELLEKYSSRFAGKRHTVLGVVKRTNTGGGFSMEVTDPNGSLRAEMADRPQQRELASRLRVGARVAVDCRLQGRDSSDLTLTDCLIYEDDPVAVSDRRDPLQFGKPTVKTERGMGMTKIMVQAKNLADRPLTCTVTATFLKGDSILGVALGTTNEHPTGANRTITMLTTDSIKGYDKVNLEASACF